MPHFLSFTLKPGCFAGAPPRLRRGRLLAGAAEGLGGPALLQTQLQAATPALLGKDTMAVPRSLGLHSQNLGSWESLHSRVCKLGTGKTKHLRVRIEQQAERRGGSRSAIRSNRAPGVPHSFHPTLTPGQFSVLAARTGPGPTRHQVQRQTGSRLSSGMHKLCDLEQLNSPL